MRATYRRLRAAQSEPGAAAHLVTQFSAHVALKPTAVVAGYRAIQHEIDPAPLLAALDARGLTLALPAISADALVFRAWRPGLPLVPGAFGIEEPGASAVRLEPDVVLVPLLAFDRRGHRLGYGAGYYDRALAALRAGAGVRAVGLAFDFQGVEVLPSDGHDEPLDAVVTPTTFHDFHGRTRS